MIKQLDTKAFMAALGLQQNETNRKAVNRAMASKRWKKQPLVVSKEKNPNGGRDMYFVLWDTETNLPATATGEHHEEAVNSPVQITEQNSSATSTTITGAGNVISIEFANQRPAAAGVADMSALYIKTPTPAPFECARSENLATEENNESAARLAIENSILPAEEKAAVVDVENLDLTVSEPVAEIEPAKPDFKQAFFAFINATTIKRYDSLREKHIKARIEKFNGDDVLFHQHITKQVKQSERALKSKYKAIFERTGELPAALQGVESRGRPTSLSNQVVSRFIEIVTQSVELDKSGNPNVTQALRKVTSFHYQLEQELNQVISLKALYQLVKSCNLKHYFLKQDDEKAKEKEQSFFPFTRVYEVVQMDGVQTDFIALGDSLENFRFIDCIEFYDHGSRRLMAMHGYFGESNANSVDIFNRFIGGNDFPQTDIHIRPDNAKGFVNLRRCITEINNRYARAEGFTFIDDFARPGTPIDKAHLESSHRAFHNFEHHIIQHFRNTLPAEKIIGSIKKRKKINDQSYKTITVNIFDLSIDEFNAAGMLAKYVTKHNTTRHAFNEDGEKRTWIPEKRYAEYLRKVETFKFTAEDLERNLVYGSTKETRKVQKGGLIEFKVKGYQTFTVEKLDRFNSHSNTDVQISYLGNGKLAVFADGKDGEFICFATALKAPVKSEKIIAIEQQKKEKAVAGGSYNAIKNIIEAVGIVIIPKKEEGLRDLISQGLTIAMTTEIIDADKDIRSSTPERQWFFFVGAAKEAINNLNRSNTAASRNTL